MDYKEKFLVDLNKEFKFFSNIQLTNIYDNTNLYIDSSSSSPINNKKVSEEYIQKKDRL